MPSRTGECRADDCQQTLCERMKAELRCFSFLSDVEMGEITPYFNCRMVPARSDVWRAGDADDYLAFIISGKVELKVNTEFPGKQVVVGVFSRGAVIGAGSVLSHHPRTSTARTLEDCGLVLLAKENFEALLEAYPRTGVKLLKGVLLSESHRLRRAYARLASVF
ncbi:MAG: cyclic nucleotide-binding domain-containing protein [Desulfuromonadales bacterium]|nr:cyclic nucleotide-binding domain-containing protein [Desulfuromonadales bacterium]